MPEALEIQFHGIEKSAAVEARVVQKHAKLKQHFGRMTACRVVIEAPQRSASKPTAIAVKIEISVPDHKPIIVSHEREAAHVQEELFGALKDAFDAALRRIDELADQRAGRARRG
ncbi:MAG: HPF/RaiA family ribosome-associated protein [Hyphomicrobiales bacterium]|nr:HPF/RaiA family ribosome-associated protein [Hyphomicrobiales bacterium]